MIWLLRSEVLQSIEAATNAGVRPSPEQATQFATTLGRVSGQAPRNMRVTGKVAEIRVEGILTPKPDLLLYVLGMVNTTYEQIQEALAMADSDPSVERILMHYESPGGAMHGFFETVSALQHARKPVSARVSQACSAAYGLAASSGTIEATGPAVELGSVGVFRHYVVAPDAIAIANTQSPAKRPDPKSSSGMAMIQKELDAIFSLFVEAIATGRKTTQQDVIDNYGKGAIVLAGSARKIGMIDRIASYQQQSAHSGERATTGVATTAEVDEEQHAEDIIRRFPPANAKGPTRDIGDQWADAMGLPKL